MRMGIRVRFQAWVNEAITLVITFMPQHLRKVTFLHAKNFLFTTAKIHVIIFTNERFCTVFPEKALIKDYVSKERMVT